MPNPVPLKSMLLALACCSIARAEPAVVDVTQRGVVGDGATLNTPAIQRAIDACAGAPTTLRFPPGRYVTGTVELASDVTLSLDAGATIVGSADPADYRNVDPFIDGVGQPMGYALIVARGARRVGIVGGGTIDGNATAVVARQSKPYAIRPFLIRWIDCADVTLRDVTLRNPVAWTNHFFRCRDVTVDAVTIRAADARLANNDGIDVDSSTRVRITRCDIVSGDDAICLKSTSATPTDDVTITDCKLSTRCNGLKLGTESLGGFTNVRAHRLTMPAIGMSGIAIYCVDGGTVRDVEVDDVSMDRVSVPISIRLGSRLRTFRDGDVKKPTGTLGDVTIRNVNAERAALIGLLVNGVPDHPIDGLTLENVRLICPGGKSPDATPMPPEHEAKYPEYNMFGTALPASGAFVRHVRNLTLTNVTTATTRPDARPRTSMTDVEMKR